MPKQKTKKSIVKRFRRTARGKLLRTQGGKSHLATSKSRKRKRQLRGTTVVADSFTKQLSVLMGK